MFDDSIVLAAVGTTVACTTTASAATAIPLTQDGKKARIVRLQADNLVHVAFGTTTSIAATTNHALFNSNFDRLINVHGFSHFSGIARAGTAVLNITPVEY